jgi:hypothetical protein
MALVAGGGMLAGVVMALGWGLVMMLGGHPEGRSLVRAVPQSPAAWSAPAGSELVNQSIAVETFPHVAAGYAPAQLSLKVRAVDPIGGLALVMPPRVSDNQIVTGSLGPPRSRPAALRVASADRSAPELQGARLVPPSLPLPLPRARPRLASLTPLDGVKTGDDPRGGRTAIYDITAQVVHLPNGERLEAHSGLGRFMDDPSSANLRMRGVTPPNTYTLKLRESLFHGVQAIRMTPVNEDRMFGRNGILAHSYMLGPNGQSNGCISFRDYPRFLRAFQRGEIDRIVVVERLSKTPTFARRSTAPEIANIF